MTWTLAQHMGSLHPFEQVLVLLIAFGPFAVLGVLVHRRRRRELEEEARRGGDR